MKDYEEFIGQLAGVLTVAVGAAILLLIVGN